MSPPRKPRTDAAETPTVLEMMAFFTLAGILITAIQALGAGVALHWHLFGRIGLRQLAYQPRFTIPMMVVSYGAVLLAAAALLAAYGRTVSSPASIGIFLRSAATEFGGPILGVGLGFTIQMVSNYLPVPKELPVDAFFQNALDAWLVALFGILIAPIAEEIAFRGFLYPSLRPWTGKILAAILTSIPFALLHAQQVGHAWGPLAMVFLVSLVLVAVRERTGSVAASALVHACYNLSIFAVIFFASGGFLHSGPTERLASSCPFSPRLWRLRSDRTDFHP